MRNAFPPRRTARTALALLSITPLASAQEPAADVASFRQYATAHDGDAAKGRETFNAAQSLCTTCHSVDGSASKVGPDLGAIGDKFSKADLIRSVLEPSATVAVGYGVTSIVTRSGETHVGIVKSSSPDVVELKGVDGVLVRVATADIASQKMDDVSLMPGGLYASMGQAGFTDLISYLQSLHSQAESGVPGSPASIPLSTVQAKLEPLFAPPFDHPTWFGWIPGRGSDEALVLEHAGRIWSVGRRDGAEHRKLILDLTGIVRRGGATGLLGMDFHPGYEKNRRYFLKYQVVEDGVISTVIDERTMLPDRDEDSGTPPRQIIKIRSTTQDHNGGSIGFGPDGYLYFGMGDTGPQRDPQGHGQDMSLLLGKMMRIDVDRTEDGLAYAIPADNPFRGVSGARPEIWASGFREPFRLSWDSKTGDLWVGDVGQDRYEEVDIVRRGENLGWNVYEGHYPFSETYRRQGENYIAPVMSYSHRLGVSVTGGVVYRGIRAPQLDGWYLFGDHETRRVWALTQIDRKLDKIVEIARSPSRITAFARDPKGEISLAGFDDGTIYRLILDQVDPRPLATRVVAETSERTGVLWRYSSLAPADGWTASSFDDSGWSVAPAGFGTAGTPGGVIRTDWHTADIWLRREFDVSPELAAAPGDLGVRMHHDEDVDVFINGSQVLHRNGWTQGYMDEKIPDPSVLKPGRNVIAIHCHQVSGGQYIDAGLVKSVSGG
jgi:putative heme-binding domain-containing protein